MRKKQAGSIATNRTGQRSFIASLTLLASVVIMLMAIGIGSVTIRPQDILLILVHKILGRSLPASVPANIAGILWSVRLPRVLLAFLVGAALSVSGVVMQSVLKNPLASSFTLGVSSGSSLGAAFVLLFGLSGGLRSSLGFPIAGFIFGVGTVFLVLAISKKLDKRMENTTIILIGLVISQFFGGILTLLMSLARETMERLVLWQLGSFSGLGWSAVSIVALVLAAGSLILMRYNRELDIMTFGESQALTLGINLPFIKPFVLVVTALLTGASISLTGVIGFVDLIAPHLTRRIFGSSHRAVLPMSMLLGGSLMVMADLLARTLLAPRELPVGAITAIIGAPFFAYVYFKRRKGESV